MHLVPFISASDWVGCDVVWCAVRLCAVLCRTTKRTSDAEPLTMAKLPPSASIIGITGSCVCVCVCVCMCSCCCCLCNVLYSLYSSVQQSERLRASGCCHLCSCTAP